VGVLAGFFRRLRPLVMTREKEMDHMEDLVIAMALTTLLSVVKNPSKVKKLKGALTKLRDALIALNLDNLRG